MSANRTRRYPPPPGAAGIDYDKLERTLARMKLEVPEMTSVTFAVKRDVPASALTRALSIAVAGGLRPILELHSA